MGIVPNAQDSFSMLTQDNMCWAIKSGVRIGYDRSPNHADKGGYLFDLCRQISVPSKCHSVILSGACL